MEESLCIQIARRMDKKDFTSWIGKAYGTFKIEERTAPIKILKKRMYFKDVITLCKFIEQFPDVNDTFIAENLSILENIPEEKSRKRAKPSEEIPQKVQKQAEEKQAEEKQIPTQKQPKEIPKKSKTEQEPITIGETLRPKFKIPIIGETRAEKVAECLTIAVLENFTNSCYMDSILMIFFTVLEEFTERYIVKKVRWSEKGLCNVDPLKDEEIRTAIKNAFEALHDIMATLKEPTKCYDFRELLCTCNMKGFEKFCVKTEKGTMRDASEFLTYLFRLFEINTMQTAMTTIGKKTGQEEFTEVRESDLRFAEPPVWLIPFAEMHLYKKTEEMTSISTVHIPEEGGFGEIIEGKFEFSEYLKTRAVFDTPILVISLQRRSFKDPYIEDTKKLLSPSNEILDSVPIIPSERITTLQGKMLILVASVVYANHHYTTIFRCNNQWYHYNDLGKGKHVRLFAPDYEGMIKAEKAFVTTNGTLHFYIDEDNLGIMNTDVQVQQ